MLLFTKQLFKSVNMYLVYKYKSDNFVISFYADNFGNCNKLIKLQKNNAVGKFL